MKKNILIGVLSFTSIAFLLFAFTQRVQNEELKLQLRGAESMAKMYQEQAEAEKIRAIKDRESVIKNLKLAQESAEKSAERAMEAAQNPKK